MVKIIDGLNNNITRKKNYRLIEDVNIYKKTKFTEVEVRYFMYLTQKYGLSNGIDIKNMNINPSDFTEWLKAYIEMTKKYASFVKSNDINLEADTLAELGKGKCDSIITKAAYEISEFSETMKRPKLVFGDVNRGLLIHKNSEIFSLEDLGISTLITQNPNELSEIKNLTILSNDLDKNFAFGVYGNFSDKDTKMKTGMIKKILESTNNNEFVYETDKDYYYMLIKTADKKKDKILRR